MKHTCEHYFYNCSVYDAVENIIFTYKKQVEERKETFQSKAKNNYIFALTIIQSNVLILFCRLYECNYSKTLFICIVHIVAKTNQPILSKHYSNLKILPMQYKYWAHIKFMLSFLMKCQFSENITNEMLKYILQGKCIISSIRIGI